MPKQLIITKNDRVIPKKQHTCYKCGEQTLIGEKVHRIVGTVNTPTGKEFRTLYFCTNHKIRTYCNKKVIYVPI